MRAGSRSRGVQRRARRRHQGVVAQLPPIFGRQLPGLAPADAEPSLVEDGWGTRSFSYTLGASSMKAQAGTLAKLGCMIRVDCDDGAIDSVELFINFLAEEELADGYFMARVRARVPGFD